MQSEPAQLPARIDLVRKHQDGHVCLLGNRDMAVVRLMPYVELPPAWPPNIHDETLKGVEDLAARAPLTVVGAARAHGNAEEFYVDVRDPNEGDAPGRYVVVREYGELVVDLVASAALTARAVEVGSGEERFEPAALTPADYDRIREYELSQPPAKPGGN